jgi:hypothetical protein
LATYLFEMGAPLAAIAAALGHKGTRKAGIYIKTTAAIADKIAHALIQQWNPWYNAFSDRQLLIRFHLTAEPDLKCSAAPAASTNRD